MSVITEEEFVKIVNDKKRNLFKLAKGILNNDTDAEDALAEAVLTAWKKRDQVQDNSRFDAWLYRITINKAITMRHKKNREIPYEDIPEDQDIEEEDMQSEIWEYVLRLKPKYSIPIILYYRDELSVREIAEFTGLKEGTIKSRLHRAREMLKDMIPYDMYSTYYRGGALNDE